MRRAWLLTLLIALLMPATASAGVASVDNIVTDPKYGSTDPALFFVAGPGERNQLTLARLTDPSADFALRDAGAALRAGPGCSAIDEHTVTCHASAAYIDAGDGDDTVAVAAVGDAFVRVRGGDGDDALTGAAILAGGTGRDVITGAPNLCGAPCRLRAVLAGGPGPDMLSGGPADEELNGDGNGPAWPPGHDDGLTTTAPGRGNDVIDGGGGTDKVSYAGDEDGVRVDLAAGLGEGYKGEIDRLRNVEDATGGDGPDVLLGDGGDNVLEGGSRDDRLYGRGGRDYLLGNVVPDSNEFSPGFTPADPGADALHGGAGGDRLDAGGERGDTLFGDAGDDLLENASSYDDTRVRTARCGAGRDVVRFEPRGQDLSDCEVVDLANAYARISPRPVRRAGGTLRFSASCVRTSPFEEPCKLGLRLLVRSSTVARRDVTISQGARRAFVLRPRRAARRGDVLDVAMTLKSYGQARPRTGRWRVRLR